MGKAAGFTLIELLVTLTVSAILLAVAVPSYQHLLATNRLVAVANAYILAISEARLEAIRRNTTIQVCGASGNGSGDLATACGTTSMGAVYALPADPDDDPILIRSAPAVENLHIDGFTALSYNAQGLARAPGGSTPLGGLVADLRSEQLSSDSHRCIYITTGSSLQTCTNDTTCDATEPADCN